MKQSFDGVLYIILGDQLSRTHSALGKFEGDRGDCIWMAEAPSESKHAWSSKQRIVFFLSAMRHFAEKLKAEKLPLVYSELEKLSSDATLGSELTSFIKKNKFKKAVLSQPGDYRVLQELKKACKDMKLPLDIVPDTSFYSTPEEFAAHAADRKQLRMEFFYREMRKRHSILMDDGKPIGGKWNFDGSNRKAFGKSGPDNLFPRFGVEPDSITESVKKVVTQRFADHPGTLDRFTWPVTEEDAREALRDFIENHLAQFGVHQDAMWTDEPFLSHSLIAPALNVKLLTPKEAVEAAEKAYHSGSASIESVEGFIRQVLGWREYVRGVYWSHMPEYLENNALGANEPLPSEYWTGETDMHCIRQVVTQTLNYGYAHHIQRLMVTGLYSLLLGVEPKAIHQWYLSVYVDAVEWVELPNTLGMSQYADNGIMGSKPYVATGKYIKRMSNYCKSCRYNPDLRVGEDACPMTTLYWNFLDRHKKKLEGNPRMTMQLRNLKRIDENELEEINKQSSAIVEKNRENSSS